MYVIIVLLLRAPFANLSRLFARTYLQIKEAKKLLFGRHRLSRGGGYSSPAWLVEAGLSRAWYLMAGDGTEPSFNVKHKLAWKKQKGALLRTAAGAEERKEVAYTHPKSPPNSRKSCGQAVPMVFHLAGGDGGGLGGGGLGRTITRLLPSELSLGGGDGGGLGRTITRLLPPMVKRIVGRR